MPATPSALITAARRLRAETARLRFRPPVSHIYNPLAYAWAPYEAYLRKFAATPKRVIFLGMNPGPFGMAQTGVPFGEVAAVRDWLRIERPVGKPPRPHPRRPVTGFACARSEVSGRRLWGLFAERFGTPQRFFADAHRHELLPAGVPGKPAAATAPPTNCPPPRKPPSSPPATGTCAPSSPPCNLNG